MPPAAGSLSVPAAAYSRYPRAAAGRQTGRRQMIQTNGIDHIVLHCRDIERTKRFYTEILGMTVYSEGGGQLFMHAGGQGVALFERPGEAPIGGGDMNHLALNVADGGYESLKAELERHGVEVTGRPGDDHCIYFRDPDGHRLQLIFHR
jgi:catechol 2,3-dioxygenase-like lactoylglutathione lyase family enzyme